MASVLSNAYQRQWIAKNREAEAKERDEKSSSKTRLLNKTLSPTKASMGYAGRAVAFAHSVSFAITDTIGSKLPDRSSGLR